MKDNISYKQHLAALAKLGLPIMIGQLGIIVLGFADTMMIGHHSTAELAAASFVNNMMNLAIIFGTGFSYGLTPIVGALFGRGEKAEAGQALRCSLLSNALVAAALMAVMGALYFFIADLGQPRELLPFIRPYYLVVLLSLLPMLLFNGFKQFTDGITDTKTAMWLLLAGNVMNIIGNYALIYGKAGLPEMGLLGAGISTLASRVAMAVAFALIFARSRRFNRYKVGFLRRGWSRGVVRRLNVLGWPIALQMGMETASFSLTTIMVGWLGTVALASHQVMLTVSTFTFMIYYGLGAAISIRVSNFHGKGDTHGVRRTATAGFLLMVALEVVLSSAVAACGSHIGWWFTDNAQVASAVASLIVPFLIYQFGDGLQITFANALRGISEVKVLMAIAFVAYFVISLPVAYLFGFTFGWGLVGIWLSTPFGLTTAGALMWLRFRQKTSGQSFSATL